MRCAVMVLKSVVWMIGLSMVGAVGAAERAPTQFLDSGATGGHEGSPVQQAAGR